MLLRTNYGFCTGSEHEKPSVSLKTGFSSCQNMGFRKKVVFFLGLGCSWLTIAILPPFRWGKAPKAADPSFTRARGRRSSPSRLSSTSKTCSRGPGVFGRQRRRVSPRPKSSRPFKMILVRHLLRTKRCTCS